jgi:hypothetical protein
LYRTPASTVPPEILRPACLSEFQGKREIRPDRRSRVTAAWRPEADRSTGDRHSGVPDRSRRTASRPRPCNRQ